MSRLATLALFFAFCAGAADDFEVTAPPAELKLPEFYKKYISANGYPVVSSEKVSDYALKEAAQETIKFLQKERGLSAEDAYSLAAIAVNYVVAEAVDDVLMVYGAIPKKIFSTNPAFWAKP